MLSYSLGPRAHKVYVVLRERIFSGEFASGSKLPSHTDLAREFGVAPLTMRQVLALLEQEGVLSLEHGRGTFVREQTLPGVLIVEDDASMRDLLSTHVKRVGYRPIEAATPAAALATLQQDPSISLILSDIRMPTKEAGVEFIRTVHRRWPETPLAVVTSFPDDLSDLHGTPECPVLILPKPVWAHQIEEVLHLALRQRMAPPSERRLSV